MIALTVNLKERRWRLDKQKHELLLGRLAEKTGTGSFGSTVKLYFSNIHQHNHIGVPIHRNLIFHRKITKF
jgi:hypothetical protein